MSTAPTLAAPLSAPTVRFDGSSPELPWEGCGGGIAGGVVLAAPGRDRLRLLVGQLGLPRPGTKGLDVPLRVLLRRETLAASPLPETAAVLAENVRQRATADGFSATLVDLFTDGRVQAACLASPPPALARPSGEVSPLVVGGGGTADMVMATGELLLVYSVGFVESARPGTLGAAPRQFRLHRSVDAVWATLMERTESRDGMRAGGTALAVLRPVQLDRVQRSA